MAGPGTILRQTHGTPAAPADEGPGTALKKLGVPTTTVKTTTTDAEGNPVIGTAEDVAKTLPNAVRTAHEGLVGMQGDVYGLIQSGASRLAKFLGASPELQKSIDEARGQSWGPTTPEVHQDVTRGLEKLGPAGSAVEALTSHDPQTRIGKIANTVTQLATTGRPVAAPFRSVIAPAAGMEGGGEIGKQLGNETLGRLLGGALGATVPTAAIKWNAPKQSGARADQIRTLTDEGVDLTGGQASGRKALQYREVGPYANRSEQVSGQQSDQFTQAALKRAGINANEASPKVLSDAYDNFGREYDDLVTRAKGVPLDSQMQTDVLTTLQKYEDLMGVGARPAVEKYFQRISDAARDNGGVIPADTFKTIRSDIARDLKGTSSPETAMALREFSDHMFDSIGRNGQPDVVAAWKDTNNRYRNYKTIEAAMKGGGETTLNWKIDPAKLRAAAESSEKGGGAARGEGDLTQLAKSGNALIRDLPQSGTGPRSMIGAQGAGAMLLMQQLMAQDLKHAGMTAAATAGSSMVPALVSRLLTAKPVRTALVKNTMGDLPIASSAAALNLVPNALEQRYREKQ